MTRSVIGLFCMLVLVSCAPEEGAPKEITSLPRELTEAEQKLIDAQNTLGFKLLKQLSASLTWKSSNIFISPLSISMALGMTSNGAASGTAAAILQTLELAGLTQQQADEAYRSLIDLLADLDPAVELSLANSIWYRSGLMVKQAFLEANRQYFDAQVSSLDFSSPAAASTINKWVSDKTRGRIDKIVDDPIDKLLMMFLINAIYFKGSWTTQFDKELTARADFTLADGSHKVGAQMMSLKDEALLRTGGDEDLEMVELPYGGKAHVMTLLLPATGKDILTLLKSLDGRRFKELASKLVEEEVVVRMPKIKLEYGVKLKETLKSLGMELAFDPTRADFSKICSSPRLYISEVKHKTFVDVNEEGTEAAAVTSVEAAAVSAPREVRIDRPYVMTIRERLSGTILFVGVILNPTLTE